MADATRRIRSMKRSDAGNVPIIAMSANAFAGRHYQQPMDEKEAVGNSEGMHYVPGPFLKKQHRNSLERAEDILCPFPILG